MHFEKRKAKIEWRKSLTTEEAVEVERIDARCAKIDAERRTLSRELFLIRNRATKRAKAAAVREALSAIDAPDASPRGCAA